MKVQTVKGYKVKITSKFDLGEDGVHTFTEIVNFAGDYRKFSVEDFKLYNGLDDDGEGREIKVEIIEKDIDLYRVTKNGWDGTLAGLCNSRDDLLRRIKNPNSFDELYTKQDIINLLDKGYLVAVKGIGEVDKNDMVNL